MICDQQKRGKKRNAGETRKKKGYPKLRVHTFVDPISTPTPTNIRRHHSSIGQGTTCEENETSPHFPGKSLLVYGGGPETDWGNEERKRKVNIVEDGMEAECFM